MEDEDLLIDDLYDEIYHGISEAISHLKQKRTNLNEDDLDEYLDTLGKAARLMKMLEKQPVKSGPGTNVKVKAGKDLGYSSKKYLEKSEEPTNP